MILLGVGSGGNWAQWMLLRKNGTKSMRWPAAFQSSPFSWAKVSAKANVDSGLAFISCPYGGCDFLWLPPVYPQKGF